MRHYALAVDRVRYTGEPVAVARDRYAAEDALERIEVEYRELDPVVDPVAAAAPGAPLLHREVGSNVVSDRRLRYGDPDAVFASAVHRVAISVRYPRNACTPDRGVRRRGRTPRGRRLRRAVQLPGSVHAASGDGAGAGGVKYAVSDNSAIRSRRHPARPGTRMSSHAASTRANAGSRCRWRTIPRSVSPTDTTQVQVSRPLIRYPLDDIGTAFSSAQRRQHVGVDQEHQNSADREGNESRSNSSSSCGIASSRSANVGAIAFST